MNFSFLSLYQIEETLSRKSLGVPLELRRHVASEERNHAQAKEHHATNDRRRDRLPLRSRPDEHMLVAYDAAVLMLKQRHVGRTKLNHHALATPITDSTEPAPPPLTSPF
ncbi:hypothetical protein V6N13_070480 [Hibiscus sabdariffa]